MSENCSGGCPAIKGLRSLPVAGMTAVIIFSRVDVAGTNAVYHLPHSFGD